MATGAFDEPPRRADEHGAELKVGPNRQVAQLQHFAPRLRLANEDQQMITRSFANHHRIS